MNQHAKAPDQPGWPGSRPARRPVSLIQDPAIGGEKPKLHYLAVSPKPDVKPDPEPPLLSPIVSVQSQSGPNALKPAVWSDPEPRGDVFLALQRWEGVVTDCREETFLARLTDLTTEGKGEEEVELLLDDIPEEDRSLVAPGAVFYWAIGYRYEPSGQSSRVSTLRFRRLPVWSESELDAAKERARQIAEVLGGN